MSAPLRQTLREYCKRTDDVQISLGFQPTNPINFDVKNYVLLGLKGKSFDRKAIIDPWEHLAKVYETCSILRDIIKDQVKLHLFGFSLIGRAKGWL